MANINPKWFSMKPTYVNVVVQSHKTHPPKRRHCESAGEQINFEDLSRPGGRHRETYTHTSPLR